MHSNKKYRNLTGSIFLFFIGLLPTLVFSGISSPNHNFIDAVGNEYPGTLCDKERKALKTPKSFFSRFNEDEEFISCGYIEELTIEGEIGFENNLLKDSYLERIKENDFRKELVNSFRENLKKYNRGSVKIAYGGRFPSEKQRAIRYKILFFAGEKEDFIGGAVVAVEVLPSFVATLKNDNDKNSLTGHTYDYKLSIHIIRSSNVEDIKEQFIQFMVEKLKRAEFSI